MSLGMSAVAVTAPVHLGEGPHWCPKERALYYVDIFEQDVHRYHPQTETHSKLHINGGPVTFVVPHAEEDRKICTSVGRDVCLVTWPDKTVSTTATEVEVIASVESHLPNNRFNDAKCDSLGRLWAGTMGKTDIPENENPHQGALYRLDGRNDCPKVIDKVSIANGLTWSSDNQTFFFIDSCAMTVDAYNCDITKGTLGNRRTVVDYHKLGIAPAFPDGMTIDTAGRLWVASFGAGKVHCFDPETGKEVGHVAVPASNVTSVTWGGDDLCEMFITTTTKRLTAEQLKQQPLAGAVFRAHYTGARGYKSYSLNLSK